MKLLQRNTVTTLNSTGERLMPLSLSRKLLNLYLHKYGTRTVRKKIKRGVEITRIINKKVFDDVCVPPGKDILDNYGFYLMANGSMQLIHKGNVTVR